MASTGRLQFAQALPESITAEAVMIAVNSPISSNGSVDLSQVQSAVNEIANKIRRPFTLLMKSTVLLGPGVDLIDRFFGTGQ